MQIDRTLAEALAARAGGVLIETTAQGWGGGFTAPPEFSIRLPSGVSLDAGALAYSASQADPDVSFEQVLGGLAAGASMAARPVTELSTWRFIPPGSVIPEAVRSASTPTPLFIDTPRGATTPGTLTPTATTTPLETHPGTIPGAIGGGVANQIRTTSGALDNPELLLTPDQWNWYYQEVTGSPGPAPEDIGYSRPVPAVSFDDWWKRLDAANISPARPAEPPPSEPAPSGETSAAWFWKNLKEGGLEFLLNLILFGGAKVNVAV